MIVPVPMRRHWDEPQLQVRYRYKEAGVLEDSRDLVELVEPWKVKLDCAFRVPRRHHRTTPMNPQDCEVRPAGLQGAKETSSVGHEVLQQVEDLVAEGHVEVVPSVRHRVGNLEGERPVAGGSYP